jgi:hypothetical protein
MISYKYPLILREDTDNAEFSIIAFPETLSTD